ncbi:hypothetical protein DVW05_16410 [Clostridium botulinum]|uniref:hypothetical protein n=1 Tax=Clostridium sp. ZBS18 TaxID=2949967 RepID=UPI001D4B4337|nr:hypothetical protein [Clostridium sp. ZBS18]MBN1056909.1 hypothetical protein [Clostridium botulinum]
MNKKLKLFTSMLLLGCTLLTSVPAHAATVTSQEENLPKQESVCEIDNEDEGITRSGETGFINAKNVALRENPGLHTKVLKRLNKPQKVIFAQVGQRVYKDGYYWVKVGYPTSNGYIIGYVAQCYID